MNFLLSHLNDRCAQLVKDATIEVRVPIVNSDGKAVTHVIERGISVSKLIEVVVEECIQQITLAEKCKPVDDITLWQNVDGIHITYLLRKHFGVE